ncbi:hypothetical protein HER18_08165 [Chryseobacterium sp. NEB161]|nr:hypothetical protein HER18_08165 [Chryseobacterium sp. NEB161]
MSKILYLIFVMELKKIFYVYILILGFKNIWKLVNYKQISILYNTKITDAYKLGYILGILVPAIALFMLMNRIYKDLLAKKNAAI